MREGLPARLRRSAGWRASGMTSLEGGQEMTVGTPVPRKEDPRLLRGRGAFADGFHARGELWARIVRSPVAHGRVRTVDLTKARRAAGVVAAVSAAELPPGLAIPVRLTLRGLPLTDYLQPVLAT